MYISLAIPANFSNINDVIKEWNSRLWCKILKNTKNPSNKLIPPQRARCLRERKHNYILPKSKTERFKRVFIHVCLFIVHLLLLYCLLFTLPLFDYFLLPFIVYFTNSRPGWSMLNS